MRTRRRTCTFSPTLVTSHWRPSSTVGPWEVLAAFNASASFAPLLSAACATSSVNFRKFSSLATKSVSELISTSTPLPPSCASAMRPSAATRSAFLSALARPCLRNHSIDASMSPLFWVSAFLHSIMPAPERSRSSLTIAAVISMLLPRQLGCAGRAGVLKWERRAAGAVSVESPALKRAPPDRSGLRHAARGGGLPRPMQCRARRGLRLRRVAFSLAGIGVRGTLRRSFLWRGAARRLAAFVVLGNRVAFGVEFDELVVVTAGLDRRGGLAFQHCVGGGARVQLHRADRVVVARNGILDQRRVVVGVDHRDHRDAELLGFLHRDVLVADVDHEQRVRQVL